MLRNRKLSTAAALWFGVAVGGGSLVTLSAQHSQHDCHALTEVQRRILGTMSLVHVEDGRGGLVPTIRISGVNVQIVNGLEATNGFAPDPFSIDASQTSTNGTGNLIIGYNELGNLGGDDRTGSHNLIVGSYNSFSGFGGLVSGQQNRIQAAYSTVGGGRFNAASGPFSSVSGGDSNEAIGFHSSVCGGEHNRAEAFGATVSGGFNNSATGSFASVAGGASNVAQGSSSCVSGGSGNFATGQIAAISGGSQNTASGWKSTVGGGANRVVDGDDDWRAGALFQDD